MQSKQAIPLPSVQWLPAERLGQLSVDAGYSLRLVDQVWVFAQTVTPDPTLCLHPPASDPLTARALRDAQIKPAGLWARRARVALRGAPQLMQEVFLPGMGRS